MIRDYNVAVSYRNRDTGAMETRRYPFSDYCLDTGYSLKRVLRLVEDAFQDLQDNKPKEEWSDEAVRAFQKIRGQLLDCANNIERLPSTLYYQGKNVNSLTGSEYLAQILGE